jgi:hypothetical protein
MGLSPWPRPGRRPPTRSRPLTRRSSGTLVIFGLGLLGAIWAPTIVLGDSAHLAADVGIDVILTVVALTLARGRHGPMRSRPGGTGVGSATSAPRSLRGHPWLIDRGSA